VDVDGAREQQRLAEIDPPISGDRVGRADVDDAAVGDRQARTPPRA
jgi:hypothetical protein